MTRPPGFPLPFTAQRIVIGAGMHEALAGFLSARLPGVELRHAEPAAITPADLVWADSYIGFRRPAQLETMGNVQWVHSTGAGVDGWLNGPALEPGILLTRSPELFGPMIAEWAVARIFAIQLQVVPLLDAQRARTWAPRDIPRVAGTRALLIGTGDIGRAIATSLASLGVHVTGVCRSGHSDHPAFSAVYPIDALPELVRTADWIVCSLPDTPATRGLVSRDLLSRCRDAVLLNAGRGAVVDETAIPEALDAGWLRAAALDVFTREPLPPDSPLWQDPRVLVSPHVSGLTTVDGAGDGFIACREQLARGELPGWAIDRARGY